MAAAFMGFFGSMILLPMYFQTVRGLSPLQSGLMVIPVGEIGDQVLRLYKKESDDTYAVRDLSPVRFVPLLPDVAPEDSATIDDMPEQLAWV